MNYLIFNLIKIAFRMGWHLSLDHVYNIDTPPNEKACEVALKEFLDKHVPGAKIFLDKPEDVKPDPDTFVKRQRDGH